MHPQLIKLYPPANIGTTYRTPQRVDEAAAQRVYEQGRTQ